MEAKLKHEHGWPSALLEGLRPGRGRAGQCWGWGPKPERAEASPGPSQLVTPVLAAWGKEQGHTRLVPACGHVCVCICMTVCVLLMYVCECVHVCTQVCVLRVYMRECACVFARVCAFALVCACVRAHVCVSPRCAVLGSPHQPVPLTRCMGLTCLQQREGPLPLVWEEEDVWKPGRAEMGRQVGGTPGLSPAHLGLPVQSPLCALTSHLPEQVALSHPGPQSCHQMSPAPPGSR